jgi:short subunit dehydrogenase-like uncharacterized protein
MVALAIIPPATAITLAWLMQAIHVPEPWGALIQYGALGVMATLFWRLANRLLDEAKSRQDAFDKRQEKLDERWEKILAQHSARWEELSEANTEALAKVHEVVIHCTGRQK